MQELIPADAEFAEAFRLATVSTHTSLGLPGSHRSVQTIAHERGYRESERGEGYLGSTLCRNLDSPDWTHIPTEQREAYRRRIGNLTLLDRNSRIRLETFLSKRKNRYSVNLTY